MWLLWIPLGLYGAVVLLSLVWLLIAGRLDQQTTEVGRWLHRHGVWAVKVLLVFTGLVLADTAARVLAARLLQGLY